MKILFSVGEFYPKKKKILNLTLITSATESVIIGLRFYKDKAEVLIDFNRMSTQLGLFYT